MMPKVTGLSLFTVEEVEHLKDGLLISHVRRPVGAWMETNDCTFLLCCRRRPGTEEEAADDHTVDFVLIASLEDERAVEYVGAWTPMIIAPFEDEQLERRASIKKTFVYLCCRRRPGTEEEATDDHAVDFALIASLKGKQLEYQAANDLPADVRAELWELKQILALCQVRPDTALLEPMDIPSHLSMAVILHIWKFIGELLDARWLPEVDRDAAIDLALRCSKLWPAETAAAASADSLRNSLMICGIHYLLAELLFKEVDRLAGYGDAAESHAAESHAAKAGRAAVQLLEADVPRLKSMSLTDNAALNGEPEHLLMLAAFHLLRTERFSSKISTGDLRQMLQDGILRSIEKHGENAPGEVVLAALYHLQDDLDPATTLSVCRALHKAHWFDDVTERYRVPILLFEALAHEKSLHADVALQAYENVLAASLATLKKAQENTENGIIPWFEFREFLARINDQVRVPFDGVNLDPTRPREDVMINDQLGQNLLCAVSALARFGAVRLAMAGNNANDVVEEIQDLAAEYLGPFFDLVERHSSRGMASLALVRSVLMGLSNGGLGRDGGDSIACAAMQIVEFAWERFEPDEEEETDPVVALTLNFIEAEAQESTTTLTPEERRTAWNGVVYEYLRAARAAGQPDWLGFHRQNWDILARAAEAAWIGGLGDETVAADLLVAKHVIDIHRRSLRATLPPGADPEGPGLGVLPTGNAVAEDVDVNKLGKKALNELRTTVESDRVEYLEYLATPRMILRLHISSTGQMKDVHAVAKDETEVQEILTSYYDLRMTSTAGKLLPSKDKLSSSSRYVIAGSGFLHGVNFRNLFSALMDGNPPAVCQVLSGPSYVDLSKHAKTKDRAHKHLVWRYWPTKEDVPTSDESERLVKLANDVAKAFQAAPPQNPFQSEAGVLECDAATLCVHGRFARPMLSAELLTAPGRWVGAREFGQDGKLPLTDLVALDLQCLRRLMIIGCVAGRVERGVGAESVGLVRTLFDHGVGCVIASLVPLYPRGIFEPFVTNLVALLAKGEAPALAVWRSWRDVRHDVVRRGGHIAPGSSADWPVVWGRGFDPW